MPDLELTLHPRAHGTSFRVRVASQSAPPPIVVFECRYFYRCYDWQYRECEVTVAARIDEPAEAQPANV
jgi:hypothetical protein